MATIQQYFSIGSSTSAKWLNDDEFVYLSTKSGVNQIWKKTLSTGREEQLTFFGERVWSVHVSDGRIFFTMDLGGNEQEQIYRLDQGSEPVNLTDNNAARHQFGGVKPDHKTVVFACNARDPKSFVLCQMDSETKEQVILLQNTDSYNTPAALSPDGRYLLYNKLKGQSDNCLWMLDIQTG